MQDFSERIASLPRDRRTPTVLIVKQLVRDMWDAGWSANSIAHEMKRDHTTILYHLWEQGVEPQLRRDRERVTRIRFKAKMETEKMKEREAILNERREAQAELNRVIALKKSRVKKERAIAVKLYKDGNSYAEIARLTGVSRTRVQGILIYDPEYHKYKRVRASTTFPRPVLQMDEKGNEIKKWGSISEAAKALGILRNAIVMTCKGRQNTTGGFKWKYVE